MSLSRQFLRAPRLLAQCQRLALSQRRCNQSMTGDADEMTFTFASPADVFYKAEVVKQVDIPTLDGVFGVLAKHVPTLAALKPGILTVFESEGASKKFFVSSGTVTVNSDSTVQILAEEAHPLDRFDEKAAQENLQQALSVLGSAKDDMEKAEAQIAVDCLEALTKAVASH